MANATRGAAAKQQKPPTKTVMGRGILKDHSNRQPAESSSDAVKSEQEPPTLPRRSARLSGLQSSVLETATLSAAVDVQRPKRNRKAKIPEEHPAKKARRSSSLSDIKEKSDDDGADRRSSRSRSRDQKPTSFRMSSTSQELKQTTSVRRSKSRSGSQGADATKSSNLRSNFMERDDFTLRPRHFDPCKLTQSIAPHDIRNNEKVLEVAGYVTDIFQRLFAAEDVLQVQPYLHNHQHFTGFARSILVDWLVQVQHKLNCVNETLYLAVNIIDRYVAQVQITRDRFQLIGVAALWIASKFEDIYPPELNDLVYICDRTYTRQDIYEAELDILRVLGFRIAAPTPGPFMCRFLTMMEVEMNSAVWFGANYYLDRMLQEAEYLDHRSSLLALAAVVLALNNDDLRIYDMMDDDTPGVPSLLLRYTGFSKTQVINVATIIADKVSETGKTGGRRLHSVRKKYEIKTFLEISTKFDSPCVDDILNGHQD